jgi:hypothetical protein
MTQQKPLQIFLCGRLRKVNTYHSMLSRLLTRASLKSFSFVPFSKGTAFRTSTRFNSTRFFRTSSHLNQQYRYVRFNDDPYGGGGKGSGSSFFSWWNRLGPIQRLALAGFGGGAPLFYATHLETVEETGRRRFIFMSRSMEESLGKAVFTKDVIFANFRGISKS